MPSCSVENLQASDVLCYFQHLLSKSYYTYIHKKADRKALPFLFVFDFKRLQKLETFAGTFAEKISKIMIEML